jgi:hypothetical protein
MCLPQYDGAPIFQKRLCIFVFQNLFEKKTVLFVLRTNCSNPYFSVNFRENTKPMFTPISNPTFNKLPKTDL